MDGYLDNLKVNQDMLYHVKNIIIASLFLVVWSSCNPKLDYTQFEEKVIISSKRIIGEREYFQVYKKMEDSLFVWKNNHSGAYLALTLYPYKLDSILCFNSSGNKVITALAFQCNVPNCLQENIWYFYGVKIKDQWYFFSGPTMVLLREAYQKDIHTPLSFEKLHEIAMENVFRGYLKKKDKGLDGETEWEINENWFKAHFESNTWCITCNTPKSLVQWDSIYLDIVKKNWSLRDTTNYEQSFTQ